MVLVPLTLLPTPWANCQNLFADNFNHSFECFGVVDEFPIVEVFPCVVGMDELNRFFLFLLTELSAVALY